jgi:hydrogenase expression/formation protein HypC
MAGSEGSAVIKLFLAQHIKESGMCVGVPMQIVSIDGDVAMTEVDGVKREASLMLLGQDVVVGDFVIIHAGFAISKLDEEDARETLAMMREVFTPESMG